MICLHLMPKEKTLLTEMLHTSLSDLRMEIADTDSMDFREKLKKKSLVIKNILDNLQQSKNDKNLKQP